MTTGYFDGKNWDFAAGTIRGIRGWNLDRRGRLVGTWNQDFIWKPETHLGVCPYHSFSRMRAVVKNERLWSFSDEVDSTPAPVTPEIEPSCSCGLYAYTDFESFDNAYGTLPVHGIVEGYGKTVVGEYGFRASSARIVALALIYRDEYLDEIARDSFIRWPLSDATLGLFMPREAKEELERLGKLYGVPIFKRRRQMLKAFPLSTP